MSTIVELTIFPTDKGDSVSAYVARALKVIQKSGLPYELNPMGTCIEGEWDQLMPVIHSCFEELRKDCDRIYMLMKADYRKERTSGLRGKVISVQTRLATVDPPDETA